MRLFLQCKQFFLHSAYLWGEADILILLVLSFLCKNKLVLLLVVILYKNLCKNVILRGKIFVFLQVIVQLSLRFILHLKQKNCKPKKFLSSLVFCNYRLLVGYILNIFQTQYPKMLTDQLLKNQLRDVIFWEFSIHSMYVISHRI